MECGKELRHNWRKSTHSDAKWCGVLPDYIYPGSFNQAEATRAVNEQQRSQIDRDGRMNFLKKIQITHPNSNMRINLRIFCLLSANPTAERPDGYPAGGGAVEVVCGYRRAGHTFSRKRLQGEHGVRRLS